MVDRNDVRKTLELLRFALGRSGVSGSSYAIIAGDGEVSTDERLCLAEAEDGFWYVYYSERGQKEQAARFERHQDAVKYFFWKLVKSPDLWAFRNQWEKETGSSF